jgi:probable phosphoglycerate mutase
MTHLFLWRHGQTSWNSLGRMQGQMDIDLDDLGRLQAAGAARLLAAWQPERIVSSDLRRARDTADFLGRLTGLDVEMDKRLRERSFGGWEGLTREEIADRYPESWKLWTAGYPVPAHGVESSDDVAHRMGAAIEDAVAGRSGPVVIVTHGGSARRALTVLTKVAGLAEAVHGLDNCHWSELRLKNGSWRLHAHNVGEPARHQLTS